jgi:hypothetical protein
MSWEKPTYEVIEMNAEIGSYQNEFDDDRGAEQPAARIPTPEPESDRPCW